MKTCTKCMETKPDEAFAIDARAPDGRRWKCKRCLAKQTVEYRLVNLEKCREQQRQTLRKTATDRNAYRRVQRQLHPEKFRAGKLLAAAVKRGDVIKHPCWVCGEQRSEAHHPAYDQPLDVVWLCPLHHKAAHHAVQL